MKSKNNAKSSAMLTELGQDNSLVINFQDNRLLPLIYGVNDVNLRNIETITQVDIYNRGNVLTVRGSASAIAATHKLFGLLYQRAKNGCAIASEDITTLLVMSNNMLASDNPESPEAKQDLTDSPLAKSNQDMFVTIGKHSVLARTSTQAAYLRNMRNSQICFGLGPAGTGKTYLAVCLGASLLLAGEVERMIITRPAVEAGERLGFLPGDLHEKFDPYMRPIYDALNSVLPAAKVDKMRLDGDLEIAPLAFMRGRTLSRAFVMLDEAQNTTSLQMKMFLTRLGDGSRMIITGDPSQTDLAAESSGLLEARAILQGIEGIGFTEFSRSDIVRHRLVDKVVQAYDGLGESGVWDEHAKD